MACIFSSCPTSPESESKVFFHYNNHYPQQKGSVFNLYGLLSALLCLYVLMSTSLVPGCAISLRRIQNDPYQPWDTIGRDYEYIDLEDQDDVPVPPVPQQHRHRKPPVGHHNFHTPPQPVSFGGQFHISRDRFVPFVASDVVLEQPVTSNPPPVVNPQPKAIPFVPDNVPQYPPLTTDEPPFIYYTPSTLYVTTRYPPTRPTLQDTFVERKRENFYSKNETESIVLRDASPDSGTSRNSATVKPYHDNEHMNNWRKPIDLSSFNKLTATETTPPATEFPYEITTSHFGFPRTSFRPNTYPTDRIRSSSEYQPSNPVISQHSRTNFNAESVTTERPILTSGPGLTTDTPLQDKDAGRRRLSSGAIAGIAVGILAPLALVAGAVVYLFLGRHFRTAAQKGVNDSYIDDSVRPSGFMNSHIELPKDSSEEMTSLDNDSFLNSLEAVTIQNYWAESAKNTKV